MKIALISDIHFGIYSATSELSVIGENLKEAIVHTTKPLFQGLIEILKEKKPNYLLVAGDLTSTGSPLEFKSCYEKIQKLADDVEIDYSNIVFCLGNHDIDWKISGLANSFELDEKAVDNIKYVKEKYQKLAHIWSSSNENSGINIFPEYNDQHSTPLTGVIEYHDCIIFVLNSGHLCTHDQKHRHGHLSKEQFGWFQEVVEKYRDSSKVKIVLLHHHPCDYPYPNIVPDFSLLEEGSELIQLCGEMGMDLVIHGHRHHPKAVTKNETNWVKPVSFICAGSLSVMAGERLRGEIPNTFHFIEISDEKTITLNNYRYISSTGWELIDFAKETPVDGTMHLGKITSKDKAIEHIRMFPIDDNIEYEKLHDDLKFINLEKLNKWVNQVFGEDNIVYNKFPDDVLIRPKEE